MAGFKVWYDANNERWTSRRKADVPDPQPASDDLDTSETPPQLTPQQRAELRRVLAEISVDPAVRREVSPSQ